MTKKIIFVILGLFLGYEIGSFTSLLPLAFISPHIPFYWSNFIYASWTAAFMLASGMLGLKIANHLNQRAAARQQAETELPAIQDKCLVSNWRLGLIFDFVEFPNT